MKILGIIPSRYASTRFPGKPLVDIAGKSMIRRVYEQASAATLLDTLLVATDDHRIARHVEDFGGQVMMTSSAHHNGTERCGEVLERIGSDYDFVINIQGDEPYISPNQIDLLTASLEEGTPLATLIKYETSRELFEDKGVVKVVFDTRMNALMFSRAPIPATPQFSGFYKHIGIYAYRADLLPQIVRLPAGTLELAESLEQLRWLENGYPIKVIETQEDGLSVDTPQDLDRLLEKYES